jgi:Leu/Phe-tRNA-protein transferase
MKTILDIPQLDADPGAPFPDSDQALTEPNGLLAWGGDLQPERLLNAYRAGIFTREMLAAYCELHRLGHAHSVEAWHEGKLAGGIYGLAIGSVFFGESMFTHQTDAGKISLIALCKHLERWSFGMMDCQVRNPHLMSMGAREISSQEFEQRLAKGIAIPHPKKSWSSAFKPDERWTSGKQLSG